jgi:phosphoribosylamine--glycine ligase
MMQLVALAILSQFFETRSMEIVLLGHMGRDEAVADRLADHKLHVLGKWQNPGLVEKAQASGGEFHVIDSIVDVEAIADYVQAIEPDMFLTNFDDSLAAGIVDAIEHRVADRRMPELWIPCPDQSASRVEWDKFYLRQLIDEINPAYNPVNFMTETPDEALDAIFYFQGKGMEVALKPRNLTGGKGVKVQGKHFDSYEEAWSYVQEVLNSNNQTGIEIQEKVEGHEFTLQLFTDGKTLVKPPATYDYPYREDGDEGPGTGGMGAFSMQPGENLPFVDQADYDEAVALMERLLESMRERGDNYKGVLYPTFFKTSDGLKIVEVNARGGDPELINIIDLLKDDVDLGEVLKCIATGELVSDSIRYKQLASAMLYLVSPDYGYRKGPDYEFTMYPKIAREFGCKVRFAAAEKLGNHRYKTINSSRSVGISSLDNTPWAARDNIDAFIEYGFVHPMDLDYREQVAEEAYIKALAT